LARIFSKPAVGAPAVAPYQRDELPRKFAKIF